MFTDTVTTLLLHPSNGTHHVEAVMVTTSNGSTKRLGTGDIVGGRYKIQEPLARGGMNDVFLAADLEAPDSLLIVKTPRSDVTLPDEYFYLVKRLRFEYRVLTELSASSRIVHAIEYLDSDHGGPALVEKYVKGTSLREIIPRGRNQLLPEKAAEIMTGLLQGLEDLRSHGYPHGDVKPGNLILQIWPGTVHVVLIDLSATQGDSDSDATQFRGAPAYTLTYASPERIREGQQPSYADDVYACGVVLHEMLTGSRPDTAQDAEGTPYAAESTAHSRNWSPSDLRENLLAVARTAMAPKAQRYGTAQHMLEAVRNAVDDAPPTVVLSGDKTRYDTARDQDQAYTAAKLDDMERHSADRNWRPASPSSPTDNPPGVWPSRVEQDREAQKWHVPERARAAKGEMLDALHELFPVESLRTSRRKAATRSRATDRAIASFHSSRNSERNRAFSESIERAAFGILQKSATLGTIYGILAGIIAFLIVLGVIS